MFTRFVSLVKETLKSFVKGVKKLLSIESIVEADEEEVFEAVARTVAIVVSAVAMACGAYSANPLLQQLAHHLVQVATRLWIS